MTQTRGDTRRTEATQSEGHVVIMQVAREVCMWVASGDVGSEGYPAVLFGNVMRKNDLW